MKRKGGWWGRSEERPRLRPLNPGLWRYREGLWVGRNRTLSAGGDLCYERRKGHGDCGRGQLAEQMLHIPKPQFVLP